MPTPAETTATGSSLTLISHPLCPFVQRAAIVLLEKGVAFDRIDVDLSAKPEWFLALSPTGKVPVLKVRQANGDDAILSESMVICEYLEESQGGAPMYPNDALSRARYRGWIEFGTATLADAWQFLNATNGTVADAKRDAFQNRLQRLESILKDELYFDGYTFGMVDVVFAPILIYFGIIDQTVAQPIFDGLPRISAWRNSLADRPSVIDAVADDYADRFRQHLRQHQALVAA